jgi:glycosyltransferase involved in cell wall biosynthesis
MTSVDRPTNRAVGAGVSGASPGGSEVMEHPAAPAVTVVVPTRNSARTLEACLRSIRGQLDALGRPFPLELIVVDNHSTDGTAEIAARLAHRLVVAGPERSAQRNLGAATGSGPLVAFIDSDQILEPHVVSEAAAALDADREVGVVVVPERSFGEGFWVRCRSLERRVGDGDRRTEAGRIYRRHALRALGGFDEQLTGPEDWELHDRMVAAGWRVARTTSLVHHDEGHITLRATFTKKRYYGRWLGRYRQLPWARSTAFDPRRLALRPAVLATHPLTAAGLAVLKAVEAGGALCGARAAARA